jgi:type II restriction enzyme
MNFEELKQLISLESCSKNSFEYSTAKIESEILKCNKKDLITIISEIGVIPETIGHDSSEEKLFAKTTDIVLARAFSEIGIKSIVVKERANCADVVGKSQIHDYTLVGDAKAFRLSRTAKNQKDFKVKSMVDWKQDNDYSILVCPYFQYPKSNSQIYGQAIDGNVCLFSWEQMQFLLENNIKETKTLTLAPIWNVSDALRKIIIAAETQKRSNFIEAESSVFCSTVNVSHERWKDSLKVSKKIIIERGEQEIEFWNGRIGKIKKYTRDQAIRELLTALKLKEKIKAIAGYINSLRDGGNE